MLRRFARNRRKIDYDRIVSTCYETVLGRRADEAGLRSYVEQLRSGSIDLIGFLEALRASDEFRANNSFYDFRKDDGVMGFLTEEVIRLSEALEINRPISFEEYNRHFDGIFGTPGEPLVIGQKDYGPIHKQRFYELVNALRILGAGEDGATLLEFGASEFSAIYAKFFPNMFLDIADRPVPEDYVGFTRRIALGRLGARDYFSIDLNQPQLFPEHAKALPRYSHVVFCEVLEHLVVNPVEVFAFLFSLLTDRGLIYLTTPNFFSYRNLQKMKSWENPQEIYPAANGDWDAHFHHREFSLKELLRFIELAGGAVKAFYHSDCWDSEKGERDRCAATRGNLVLVAGKK